LVDGFAQTRTYRPEISLCTFAFKSRAHGSRAAEAATTPGFLGS